MAKKNRKEPVPARLFPIFAQESPTAVIFRRGPSEWVQLVKWNTETDTFELGQWFHGRIYEHRADLSPDGSLLIYFTQRKSWRHLAGNDYWTAISKPPFLTALALWPKYGCWNGGGLFENNNTVLLNHEEEVAKPHPHHKPGPLKIILKNLGGDEPIFSERLERDGWVLRQEWRGESPKYPAYEFSTTQPEIREKTNGQQKIRMMRSKMGHGFSEQFAVVSGERKQVISIERAVWVDWDQQGRLVLARDGCIFAGHMEADGSLSERRLIDLNQSKRRPLAPPQWATIW